MNKNKLSLPQLFKGIALFTPGGDLIYCIDPNKQGRWHIHLCIGLQEILSLPEPPHFLVPGYTATIDRWIDPQTQQLRTVGEVYPALQRYQGLLNVIFGTRNLDWQIAPWEEESCNPIILETYRSQFPQLWEDHDSIIRFDLSQQLSNSDLEQSTSQIYSTVVEPQITSGYVLRLFVSGSSAATKRTLETIHQLLEEELRYPYTLKVIDIFQYPEQAEINQVSATPTLVRVWPRPVRKIIGELDDFQRVLQILSVG